jgi:hypothetical protein
MHTNFVTRYYNYSKYYQDFISSSNLLSHNRNTIIHINYFILLLNINVDMIVNDKIEKVDVIVEKNKLTCLDKK